MINITESAWNKIASHSENPVLRLGIKSGGCHGFSYVFVFVENAESNDVVLHNKNARIVVSKNHLPFLESGTLDYQQEMMHAKFVFQNPKSDGSCGCGVSFTLPKPTS
ncbi:MAG: iron-sulfur cluster assembly accessory protein [Alphaproteobacteria bacterium]|nr:iron-sulfur cluster assembly accessory protein [Alphaproteobacteria bacterium]